MVEVEEGAEEVAVAARKGKHSWVEVEVVEAEGVAEGAEEEAVEANRRDDLRQQNQKKGVFVKNLKSNI